MWAVILGIAAAALLLGFGIFFLVKHFDAVVGGIKAAVSWVWNLHWGFLALIPVVGWIIIALKAMWAIFKAIRDSAIGRWFQKTFMGIEDPKTSEEREAEAAVRDKAEADRKEAQQQEEEYQAAMKERSRNEALGQAQENVERAEERARIAKAQFEQQGTKESHLELQKAASAAEDAKKAYDELKGGGGVGGALKTAGQYTGFVSPSMDMQGMGMGMPDEPSAIARARNPGMNLPAGGGAVSGSRSSSFYNEITINVSVPSGSDGDAIGEAVAEAIRGEMERQYRETQGNLARPG